MIILKTLTIFNKEKKKIISFGKADTIEEYNEIFKMRYDVYASKGYIDENKYKDGLEKDEYDDDPNTQYFIAKIEDEDKSKIIGCIRVIIKDILPTEIDFKFVEPRIISLIPRGKRFEIGRFIIVPPDKDKGEYLPRGMVMLFILNIISDYAVDKGLVGGYAFIKKTLDYKLKKAGFPIKYIKDYKQNYPIDGVLHNYFNQMNDPVIPIYFISQEFKEFTDKMINHSLIFKVENKNIIFRQNIFTHMLRTLKIV